MCGEHFKCGFQTDACPGSSPRVRGTRLQDCRGKRREGIIPACAGNTNAAPRGVVRARDHPRVCGEHSISAVRRRLSGGSSPRVRGTQDVDDGVVVRRGIIPACAGNTRGRSPRRRSCRDHPRVCGEHPAVILFNRRGQGSSPRVRGTPLDCGAGRRERGIIPACAGNTGTGRMR